MSGPATAFQTQRRRQHWIDIHRRIRRLHYTVRQLDNLYHQIHNLIVRIDGDLDAALDYNYILAHPFPGMR